MKIFHSRKLDAYDFGPSHPFRGSRFSRFVSYLNSKGYQGLEVIPPTIEVGEEHLLLVHKKDYIERIKEISETGKGMFSLDTPGFKGVYEASLAVVSNTLSSGECALREGKSVALCAGLHHAKPSSGEGFCVVNDVAILARWLKKNRDMKILIFDYDAHHGNGTMHIFYDDPSVFFISIHQDPRTLYPGDGFPHQVGTGKGEGTKCNIPMPPGASDMSYKYAIEELVLPLIREYKPDYIIANGGADMCENDSLTDLELTKYGLHALIGTTLHELSRNCPVAVLVGSGYKPDDILFQYLEWLILGIAGIKMEGRLREKENAFPLAKKMVDSVKNIMKKYFSI